MRFSSQRCFKRDCIQLWIKLITKGLKPGPVPQVYVATTNMDTFLAVLFVCATNYENLLKRYQSCIQKRFESKTWGNVTRTFITFKHFENIQLQGVYAVPENAKCYSFFRQIWFWFHNTLFRCETNTFFINCDHAVYCSYFCNSNSIHHFLKHPNIPEILDEEGKIDQILGQCQASGVGFCLLTK